MMETAAQPTSESIFSGFNNFRFPSPHPTYPPPSSPQTSSRQNASSPYPTYSPTSPNSLPNLSPIPTKQPPNPKATLCPQCKGQRFQFTSYFHNPRIFPRPPHHILPLIETSYFLSERLKSLLVTYAIHYEFQPCDPASPREVKEIEAQIESWAREMREFTAVVGGEAEVLEVEGGVLGEVMAWVEGVKRRLGRHVRGEERMEMPRGSLRKVLGEGRKVWEGVWREFFGEDRGVRGTRALGEVRKESLGDADAEGEEEQVVDMTA